MNQNPREAAAQRRRKRTIISSVVLGIAALLLLRALIVPDPGGHLLFARAQRLEATGLVQPALRQYLLLVKSYPKSELAPQALWNAAELQTDLAKAGDFPQYKAARATYTQLADAYFNSDLAPEALLRAGELSVEPLHDYVGARQAFERVLREYSETREDEAARATLGLGRVAQGLGERDAAKRWYKRVLARYPKQNETCAQAQFRLAETYETLFQDHPLWARAAYETTIKKYSQSAWASQAKERLGLLLYSTPPRERRVLVEAKTVSESAPTESDTDTSLLFALRMALRARGIDASQTLMEGLTLAPFYAGFRADDPSRAVRVPLDEFENAVANAGLIYEIEDGSDMTQAALSLQREVDAGRATLIFTGRWQFVAGYDSSSNEVMLQSGARLVTIPLSQLAKTWNRRATGGGRFTILSFHSPGEIAKSRILPPGNRSVSAASSATAPSATALNATTKRTGAGAMSSGKPIPANATATPASAAASTRDAKKSRETVSAPRTFSPQLSPLSAPSYAVTLSPLDERAIHKRIARAAAHAMRRARIGDAYANLEALQALSDALQSAANAASTLVEAQDENPDSLATPQPTEAPVRRQSEDEPSASATLEPTRFRHKISPRFSPLHPKAIGSTIHINADFSHRASTRAAFSARDANRLFPANSRAAAHARRFVAFPQRASTRDVIFAQLETPAENAVTPESLATPETPPLAPTSAPQPARDTTSFSQSAQRRLALANWRGAAATRWSVSRREAAAYLDFAASRTGGEAFAGAAKLFRQSARDLESAATALANAESSPREAFAEAARLVQSARGSETRATQFLAQAGA